MSFPPVTEWLPALGSGTNYHLRTEDSRHNNGDYHWGTSLANQSTKDAATQFWNNWGMNQSPQKKMAVNDQSLVWGGLFEIPTAVVWSVYDSLSNVRGHRTHMDGRNVDVPYTVYDGTQEVGVLIDSDPWLQLKAALDTGFGVNVCQPEDALKHFHCTK